MLPNYIKLDNTPHARPTSRRKDVQERVTEMMTVVTGVALSCGPSNLGGNKTGSPPHRAPPSLCLSSCLYIPQHYHHRKRNRLIIIIAAIHHRS